MSIARRPLKSRDTTWAKSIATLLYRIGATPNFISVMSVVFAGLSAVCFYWAKHANQFELLAYFGAALCIQLRLLCNLFDGMVAIELGLKSKSGDLFNEVPDRFADFFIITGAGYSVHSFLGGFEWGLAASAAAILTAYVRVLGASLKAGHYYIGPMAKQHRMALITAACLVTIVELKVWSTDYFMFLAVILVFAGSLITSVRRLSRIKSDLENKATDT